VLTFQVPGADGVRGGLKKLAASERSPGPAWQTVRVPEAARADVDSEPAFVPGRLGYKHCRPALHCDGNCDGNGY
jgi:hypothetical protein